MKTGCVINDLQDLVDAFLNPIAFLESVGRIDYKTGLAYNNQSMVKKVKLERPTKNRQSI